MQSRNACESRDLPFIVLHVPVWSGHALLELPLHSLLQLAPPDLQQQLPCSHHSLKLPNTTRMTQYYFFDPANLDGSIEKCIAGLKRSIDFHLKGGQVIPIILPCTVEETFMAAKPKPPCWHGKSTAQGLYCHRLFLQEPRCVCRRAAGKGCRTSYPLMDSPNLSKTQSTAGTVLSVLSHSSASGGQRKDVHIQNLELKSEIAPLGASGRGCGDARPAEP